MGSVWELGFVSKPTLARSASFEVARLGREAAKANSPRPGTDRRLVASGFVAKADLKAPEGRWRKTRSMSRRPFGAWNGDLSVFPGLKPRATRHGPFGTAKMRNFKNRASG